MKKLWMLAPILLAVASAAVGEEPPRAPVNATFQHLKSLVGEWQGKTPDGKSVKVSYTLVSDGSALMERLSPVEEGEMISMYAPDGDGVMMTHYCSMHNQPRMRSGAAGADGALHFQFVDATNLATPNDAHMDHVTITTPGPDKLVQEWAFKSGGQVQSEKFSYSRAK
jgi:hypothetical protein